MQEISEESRKSVKASANLNNDTIKRSEKSASSMPKNKLPVSEKPSRTGNRKSTFFTVDSDLMDVSGHIPENGIPFIDNLWYKDEYATDPTDVSTVSPKVLRKGNATNHVLAVIDYLKDKGYDKFQIKTMSEYSEALMESMEEKGYVKALSKWRNEGDNVTYQILDTVFGGKEFAMSSENDVDNSENIGDNESRITDKQKDEQFRQVSSHLDSYIDGQVAKGKNRDELLKELASEHSSHRERLIGGYRATARDFEARKAIGNTVKLLSRHTGQRLKHGMKTVRLR